MKKGLLIYLVVLVFIVAVIDFFILKSVSYPASTLHKVTLVSREITISGNTDTVKVTTASNGYYRYLAVDSVIEGEYVTGSYFQNTSIIPVGKWIIESVSGDGISFTISSGVPVTLQLVSTPQLYLLTVFLSLAIVTDMFILGRFLSLD